MAKIKGLKAREILNSRGTPTIEATIILDDGSVGVSSSPSGASVGKYEAKELRDGDKSRLKGLGMLKSVNNAISVIAPNIVGAEATDISQVDKIMLHLDGTDDKSKLGANTTLAISQALSKAAAVSQNLPLYQFLTQAFGLPKSQGLPTPMFNILNGGKHGAGNLDFQEFMVVPARSKSYSTGLLMGIEIYWALKDTLIAKNAIHSLGDEGGYAPNLYANSDALSILIESINGTKYRLGEDIFLSLDVAANSFYKDSAYHIKDRPTPAKTAEMVEYYIGLIDQFRLLSLEDPFDQSDEEGWSQLTARVGDRTMIVGDDLLATNLERLKKALGAKTVNAVIVKPNQVGTLTETVNFARSAAQINWKIIVSHRSGETNDDFIADFAVAVGAPYVKFGAPARGERVAKFNRLLEIEHELI